MERTERVGENLNRALHALLATDDRVCLLGEDLDDPYGGAFKVSRGLSTRFPERVLSTPISEAAIVGIAAGLALCGQRPIAEIMFGDFATLCFDQLYNFASKSVSMYGRRVPMHLVVRCPVGGNRGYGPTHSQNPQKHFIGIPHLNLFEMSAFHDNTDVLRRILDLGEPAILFEDKTLYGQRAYRHGRVSSLLRFDFLDQNTARIHVRGSDECDWVIVATGGTAQRAMDAAEAMLREQELVCQVVIPSRLFPIDLDAAMPLLARAHRICVLEEGIAGGTWGSEVAAVLHERLWDSLSAPVLRINSAYDVIPAAPHLEREVIVQVPTIQAAIRGAASV